MKDRFQTLARYALAAVCAALLVPLVSAARPYPVAADITSDQATTYNCDGTDWAFRATRLPSGSVGFAYGYAPVGGNRALIAWQSPVDIGGVTASVGDISTACIVGKVWVFARFTTPVDGTARLYERHGFPGDLANGYGGGFTDGWYHWR